MLAQHNRTEWKHNLPMPPGLLNQQQYHCITSNVIPHSGKLLRGKTFMDCLLVPPKDTTPPKFVEKTCMNSHKPRNSQKFSPSKVSQYTIPQNVTILISYAHVETSRPHKQGLPKIFEGDEKKWKIHRHQTMRHQQLFLNTLARSKHLWVLCDVRYRVFIEQ